jgi:hypothetical protein
LINKLGVLPHALAAVVFGGGLWLLTTARRGAMETINPTL